MRKFWLVLDAAHCLDPALLLDGFTLGGERTGRRIARLQFNVADALRGK